MSHPTRKHQVYFRKFVIIDMPFKIPTSSVSIYKMQVRVCVCVCVCRLQAIGLGSDNLTRRLAELTQAEHCAAKKLHIIPLQINSS